MSFDKFRDASVSVLVEHVGIASQFLVQRAIHEVEQIHPYTTDPKLFEMYFFVHLSRLLPPEVPYAHVKAAVYKAIG